MVTVLGRCWPHTGAPEKDFLRSDEAQSLPRPHVSGRPLQSPAFQAQVWGPRSEYRAYTDGTVRGLGVYTLAPQETLLIVGGIGGSGKSQEATMWLLEEWDRAPPPGPLNLLFRLFWEFITGEYTHTSVS